MKIHWSIQVRGVFGQGQSTTVYTLNGVDERGFYDLSNIYSSQSREKVEGVKEFCAMHPDIFGCESFS